MSKRKDRTCKNAVHIRKVGRMRSLQASCYWETRWTGKWEKRAESNPGGTNWIEHYFVQSSCLQCCWDGCLVIPVWVSCCPIQVSRSSFSGSGWTLGGDTLVRMGTLNDLPGSGMLVHPTLVVHPYLVTLWRLFEKSRRNSPEVHPRSIMSSIRLSTHHEQVNTNR